MPRKREDADVTPDNGNIFDVKLHEALPSMYMMYAMSCIKSRSLPDIRDGLKPVVRRTLYGMWQNNWTHTRPYVKSARVTGEVMGKYHPHGDGNIYGAAVRNAQPWTVRYPFIDGQGNFGSIDDDPPAAQRYTEMRLMPITEAMLSDIGKETVDFVPNYDGSTKEPKVLPVRLPVLLLNGSIGIAVGMGTDCAPHNLPEVVDATIKMIDNPEVSLDSLLRSIKGPDFPTGAFMFIDNIREIYETGRGSVVLRAKAEIENDGKYQSIIIKELPFQLNKAKLIAKIGELYREKRDEIEGLDGIADIRDESDKNEGIRIVIELKRGVEAGPVLSMLYRRTDLQSKHSISMVALVDGHPKFVNLRDILGAFIEHRRGVIVKRAQFDLKQAEARAHLLEGFLIVFRNLDPIIRDIKTSTSQAQAYERLRKYELSDSQIKAVLEMRVQRLAQFEQQPIIDEHKKLTQVISDLKVLIASDTKVREVMKMELAEIKHKYGDPRRTQIIEARSEEVEISEIEEVAEDDAIITVTKNGSIKRTPAAEYRTQRSKGRGSKGVEIRDDDAVAYVFRASPRDFALAFTNMGKCYKLNIRHIPASGKGTVGKSVGGLIELEGKNEHVVKVVPMGESTEGSIMMVTRLGQVKKIEAEKLRRPRSKGMVVIGLEDGDELIDAMMARADDGADIIMVTTSGLSIRFPERSIRAMGRSGSGVSGIRLDPGDAVVSVHMVTEANDSQQLMTITDAGFAKQTPIGKFRSQRRSGRGVICMETGAGMGKIIASHVIADQDDEILLASSQGVMIRFRASEVKSMGRNCKGCRIQKLEGNDRISAMSVIPKD